MATKTKKEETPVVKGPETMNWYAIRVQNNKERSVLEKLQNEVKFSNLIDKLGRTIIPTEKTIAIKNGKKVFKEKIVYPGYIFIETCARGELSTRFEYTSTVEYYILKDKFSRLATDYENFNEEEVIHEDNAINI